jgi:hypothetical protein
VHRGVGNAVWIDRTEISALRTLFNAMLPFALFVPFCGYY